MVFTSITKICGFSIQNISHPLAHLHSNERNLVQSSHDFLFGHANSEFVFQPPLSPLLSIFPEATHLILTKHRYNKGIHSTAQELSLTPHCLMNVKSYIQCFPPVCLLYYIQDTLLLSLLVTKCGGWGLPTQSNFPWHQSDILQFISLLTLST